MSPHRHLPEFHAGGAKSQCRATTRRPKACDRPIVTPTKGSNSRKSDKKRGRRRAAARANAHRDTSSLFNDTNSTGAQTGERETEIRNRLEETYNNKLSHEETLHVMHNRSRPLEEIQATEVATIVEEAKQQGASNKPTSSEEAYRQTVATTKVLRHGDLKLEAKSDDVLRFFSHNINSMTYWKKGNYKAERLKYLFKQYDIDSIGLQEVCINWSALKPSETLAALLRDPSVPLRSVSSHNTLQSKNCGRTQRGGTATILRDRLASYVKTDGTGQDPTGLGRWSWYLLEGSPGHRTRVVTAYAPCGGAQSREGTYFHHNLNYIRTKGLRTNPKDMFRDDLVEAIRQWRAQDDRVILMIDANENVLTGKLATCLADSDIGMVEAVHSRKAGPGPKTWFRGKEAIDGIWISSDLVCKGASYLPFHADLGDHRPTCIDLTISSVLGTNLPKIVPPKARRLHSKVKRIREAYITKLEASFKAHGVLENLKSLAAKASFPVSDEVARALEGIDVLMANLMTQAEKGCRKLRANHYDFSPAVKYWLDRCHAFRQLIRLNSGKRSRNPSNIKRFARRCGIDRPGQLTLSDLVVQYKECKDRTKRLLAESPWMRRTYMSEKLQAAIAAEREEEVTRLRAMLRAEAQAKAWRSIKSVTESSAFNSVTRVEVPLVDGTTQECTTKETVERGIARENSKRFGMASHAPVCHGALFELLGYSADTETAENILEGTFHPPEDADGPTLILLEEIARIWKKMGDGEVNIVISQEDFQYYWKRARERTASSYSGLHFAHYKSAAFSDYLSETHALKLSTITRTGSAPERWARGLNVMLEKVAGIALVTKLRAILLMEADFNYHNKLIFGQRMMDLARQHNMVPEEIYSEKGKTAEDAILHQVLMYDLARQWKRPLLVASVDAAQCYDRVSHAMAALTLRAYKVQNSSVLGMLRPIQNMEYYLRTGFGESSSFFGGKGSHKQGLCQGNGAAPPTWLQISTLLINAQRRHHHGVTIETPISKRRVRQVGQLYVDDTNLWTGLDEDMDELDTCEAGQRSINQWGGSLMATGGAFNAEKSGWTLHDMVCTSNGDWKYHDDIKAQRAESDKRNGATENMYDELDEIEITVPMLEGDAATISRLKTSEAVKNLGMQARPDGSSEDHFTQMRKRMEGWTVLVKNGQLPTRSVWSSYTQQLWAGLRYGLSACSAPLVELDIGMGKADFYLLSSLGVARTIKKQWRYLPSGYGGMGLEDLTAATAAATINSFLQHYQVDSALGLTLTATLENLQLELGVRDCPLRYDYKIWSPLATNTWVKALWEKIDHYRLEIDIDYTSLPFPRENDVCIMERAVAQGVRDKDLIAVNRCRKCQEALFLSDITRADGWRIDLRYLEDWKSSWERELGKHRSTLRYGLEIPSAADWSEWRRVLKLITLDNYALPRRMKQWVGPSPCKWPTFYNEDTQRLYVTSDDHGIEVFRSAGRTRSTRFTSAGHITEVEDMGRPVSVTRMEDGSLSISSKGFGYGEESSHHEQQSFVDYLHSWGGSWLWDGLVIPDDPAWIADSMRDGTLLCVTDGSHDGKRARRLCSAGWVLFCTETRRFLSGSLVEWSSSASSYRGELLGMLAIHLFLLAIEEYYGLPPASNNIHCDNKGAIYTFERKSKRVPSGAHNADVQRVLRTVKSRMKSAHLRHHVRAHQDDVIDRKDLPLPAQLNCHCDDTAKGALTEGILMGKVKTAKLPLESCMLLIDGEKQTTDVRQSLRYHIGRKAARQFYASEGVLDPETFDTIAWGNLRQLIETKPRMYQLWFGKQNSGYCGTGQWLRRWDPTASSKCPNCGKLQEDAGHLNQCRDPGRIRLLEEQLTRLQQWMDDHSTHPELVYWIPRYIGRRGHMTFAELPEAAQMSPMMRSVGEAQDQIGWRHLTEGKVAERLKEMQEAYLLGAPTRMLIDTWMKGFIEQLLNVTHSQWIYRNITKHHHTNGTIKLAARRDVLKEIEQQLDQGLNNIPPECRWLLEIDPDTIYTRRLEDQQHWLDAVNAARSAGIHAAEISDGATSSWTAIVNDGQFSHLPTKTSELPIATLPTDTAAVVTPGGTQPTVIKPTAGNSCRTLKVELERSVAAQSKVRRIRQATRRGPTSNARPAYFPLSSATSAKDRLGILDKVSPHGLEYRQTRHQLTSPLDAGTDLDTVVAIKRSDSVRRSNFARLREGVWLDDEIINYVSKQIVEPVMDRGHVYSSFFFHRLLNEGNAAPHYNFADVRRWHLRVEEGLFNLRELLVPINKNNAHWLLLRVDLEKFEIRLWDSLGLDQTNQRYLQNMLRYLCDVYQCLHPDSHHTREAWHDQWTLIDDSSNCPLQENSYDCGIFTLVNMALIAQGVTIQRSTYSQRLLYIHRTRHQVANLIRRSGATTQTIDSWLRPQTNKTTVAKRPMGRQTGRPRHHTSSTRISRTGTGLVKRKRHPECEDKNLPRSGNKRSKKSLAEDPLWGVRRYFKEYPPRTLPWEKEDREPRKRRRLRST